ncbi:fibrillarin-like rRNA/tRNA 2'-O-methyltransferase [Methanolapillus millepedarum]|uniref:Fibrillarin-like rRNA/tRNA 2'-O-methyltransferase n=1 Tax=Methanolapillus millepedarum TaxID=3028296 RepID=A0AA96V3A0_9EURY|nr:hypothetical protein MsAc7_12670 [Methanosarcinaceae archaeon Ac7]
MTDEKGCDRPDINDSKSNLKQFSDGVFEGRLWGKFNLLTKNASPGYSVYGEKIYLNDDGSELRVWDPKRSKLGALYYKRANVPIVPDSKILYLGAASGTTVSHVSDILGMGNGIVYAVEFSDRPMRDLVLLAERRKNMIPVLADASRPELYVPAVGPVDLIFQDIAQANQAEIACKNAKYFLKEGEHLILSIKARSIDVVENPKKVFKDEIRKLEKNDWGASFRILKTFDLAPYHADHLGVIAVKK